MKIEKKWALVAAACVLTPLGIWAASQSFLAPSAAINCEKEGCNIVVNGSAVTNDRSYGASAASETTNWTAGSFSGDLAVGGTLTLGSGGTAINKILKTSTSIDVNSLGGSQTTSSAVTVTGAAAGDFISVGLTGDWSAASSSVRVSGSVQSANTATLYFYNTSGTAVNLTNASYTITVIN